MKLTGSILFMLAALGALAFYLFGRGRMTAAAVVASQTQTQPVGSAQGVAAATGNSTAQNIAAAAGLAGALGSLGNSVKGWFDSNDVTAAL